MQFSVSSRLSKFWVHHEVTELVLQREVLKSNPCLCTINIPERVFCSCLQADMLAVLHANMQRCQGAFKYAARDGAV